MKIRRVNPSSVNDPNQQSVVKYESKSALQPYQPAIDHFIRDTYPHLTTILKQIKQTQTELDRRVKEETSTPFKIVQSARYAIREAITGKKAKSLTRLIDNQEINLLNMIEISGHFVNSSRSEVLDLNNRELSLVDNQSKIYSSVISRSKDVPLLKQKVDELYEKMNHLKGTPEYFTLRKQYLVARNVLRDSKQTFNMFNQKGVNLEQSESYVANSRDTLLNITEQQELILIDVEQACETISYTKRAYELVFLGTKSIAELVNSVGVLGSQVNSLDQHMLACADYLSNLRNG